ncbi:MAG: zinc ABC transporter substrate-binding protein [Clostridia bacterium]|nr:zinc ABC transporter substrate-binding protein [Clostridia bacterium]
MKRIISAVLAAAMLCVCAAAAAETAVTSFYPIWLLTLNLTKGIDGITVENLASPDTGCLHDYQLQTGDMKALAKADVFLVNGAGMESYLDNVFGAFPELTVITAADGIPLIENVTGLVIGDTDEADEDADEAEVNAHIWLDAGNAALMAANLAKGLADAFPQYAEQIGANLEEYALRLEQLDDELTEGLKDLRSRDIITFHEAFPYFAKAYGLNVAAVVNREPGETLTPTQLKQLIVTVRELGVPPLFAEPQYEDLSARTLAAETGAVIYTLDPVVTGPETDVPYDYYETVMRENMRVLREALGE